MRHPGCGQRVQRMFRHCQRISSLPLYRGPIWMHAQCMRTCGHECSAVQRRKLCTATTPLSSQFLKPTANMFCMLTKVWPQSNSERSCCSSVLLRCTPDQLLFAPGARLLAGQARGAWFCCCWRLGAASMSRRSPSCPDYVPVSVRDTRMQSTPAGLIPYR